MEFISALFMLSGIAWLANKAIKEWGVSERTAVVLQVIATILVFSWYIGEL